MEKLKMFQTTNQLRYPQQVPEIHTGFSVSTLKLSALEPPASAVGSVGSVGSTGSANPSVSGAAVTTLVLAKPQ